MKTPYRQRFILRATISYAVFATAWILFSDRLLDAYTDVSQLAWLSTIKGITFVAITTALLFLMLRTASSEIVDRHPSFIESIASGTPRKQWMHMATYVLAAVLVLLMLAVRSGIAVSFGDRPMLILFMLPIIVSALIGGVGPGLFATVIAAIGVDWLGIPPIGNLRISSPNDLLLWFFLIVNGVAVSVLSEILHRSAAKAEASRKLLDAVITGTSDAIYVKDRQGRFLLFNEAAARLTGRPAPEVLGRNDYAIFPAEVAQAFQAMDRSIMESGKHRVFEEQVTTLTGEQLILLVTKGPIYDADGEVAGIFGISHDITERKKYEEQLRQAATVFETTREGVMVTDAEQHILLVNRAFCEISGYTETEVLGKNPSILSSGKYDKEFYSQLWANISASDHWQGELWNRRKSGELYPVQLSITAVRDKSGAVVNYVGVCADVSRLKSSEAQLEHLAYYDALTQLPNRLLFQSRLEHGIKTTQRGNARLALLMLDLDRFKDVNDSYGHTAGDELLQLIATKLLSRLRGTDTIARLGGDEFAVLMENIEHSEDAGRLANEIIATINAPWTLSNGVDVHVGASIGIGVYPEHGTNAHELLQHADIALFQAKAKGRGCFWYFSEELTSAARERIALETRLRHAIEHDELRVYYQPQVEIASGRIVGAEALVRWLDPIEGLILPSRFIPIAETTLLINTIGEYVLKETCRQGQQWMAAGLPPLTLAVNLSPRQFLHSNIEDLVSRTLAETGFSAEHLELELTESALMERDDNVMEMLNRLRTIGVRLAIDDFGTGYSSLAYLKSFPLDVLKIDKRFVDDIPYHQDDMEIAATIVAMGHTLGFKVLAEGVERVEQLEFLQKQGCDMYQGFLTSPPLPPDDFMELLQQSAKSGVSASA